ncbi:alpha/beta hydrolase [Marinobacter caseinilyticus]|uniref:alpha/beta hydrolase n=1 Tax=Marinobacter caseinilyticus TaxID=2692195 RepID=UPI0014081F9C|nr:alpha/beta hydrolase [Marinobacter caseinilyticus]
MAARPQHLFLNALLLTGLFLQAGCSGMFFYPDHAVYITPDRLNLAYEDVHLKTDDGETLHGWWLPAVVPPEETARGQVYFLHGNAQNISSHLLNVAWLPARGYNVFLIDYRGYGQSTGEPDLEGALHDAETGLRWLTQRQNGPQQPLYLLGQSLGGALSIALAGAWTQRGEIPPLSAVMVDGTFSGFRAIAREKLGSFWLTWPFQVPFSWTIPNDYEGVEHIADIGPVPVMVIHSTRDTIIPFDHGQTLYNAAREPKAFLQTDTPHAATFLIPAYQTAIIEFMEQASDGLPAR